MATRGEGSSYQASVVTMSEPLPTEADFLLNDGGPVPQEAWKNFGGLSLEQAYEKFCDRAYLYSQDFEFMGERAFAYYYEVLDRYVRETIETLDEERLMVLSTVHRIIDVHLIHRSGYLCGEYSGEGAVDAMGLPGRVVSLCDCVMPAIAERSLSSRIPDSDATDEDLTISWQGLRNLAESMKPSEPPSPHPQSSPHLPS
ncbi:hypothetical protein [Botrimarina colliarenosi]|nr:hypothetical protein [Botrimarina colliarenosi]